MKQNRKDGGMMERLTSRFSNGEAFIPNYVSQLYGKGKVAEKLAEYEDAEEQGLLLRLPCPIGGTVWGWEFPTRVDEDGTEWTVCDIRRAKVVPKKFILLMLDRIGTSYFLTREEAEQALKQIGE